MEVRKGERHRENSLCRLVSHALMFCIDKIGDPFVSKHLGPVKSCVLKSHFCRKVLCSKMIADEWR